MAVTAEISPSIHRESYFIHSASETREFTDSRQSQITPVQLIDGLTASEPPDTNEFPVVAVETAVAGNLSNAVVQALIRQLYLGHNVRVVSPGQPGFDLPVDLLFSSVSVSRRGWAYEKPAPTPEEIAKLFSIKSAGEESPDSLPEVIAEFAAGVAGYPPPAAWVVELGAELVRAAEDHTVEPEISVDVDGELSFDLRLNNDFLLMGELSIGGAVDARMYDASNALVQRLRHSTLADLITLLSG